LRGSDFLAAIENAMVLLFSKRIGIVGLIIIGSYIVVYVVLSIIGCTFGAKTSKFAQQYRGTAIESSRPKLKGMFYAIACTSLVIVFIYVIAENNHDFSYFVYSLWCSVLVPLLLGFGLHLKASSLSLDAKTNLVSNAYYTASGAYYGTLVFPFFGFILLAIVNAIFDL
jgi:hypothetical protein